MCKSLRICQSFARFVKCLGAIRRMATIRKTTSNYSHHLTAKKVDVVNDTQNNAETRLQANRIVWNSLEQGDLCSWDCMIMFPSLNGPRKRREIINLRSRVWFQTLMIWILSSKMRKWVRGIKLILTNLNQAWVDQGVADIEIPNLDSFPNEKLKGKLEEKPTKSKKKDRKC